MIVSDPGREAASPLPLSLEHLTSRASLLDSPLCLLICSRAQRAVFCVRAEYSLLARISLAISVSHVARKKCAKSPLGKDSERSLKKKLSVKL
jgi:hypothetical protein